MTTVFPLPFEDTAGAWVPHGRFRLPANASGPLEGLRFAAKDLFDVAGRTTGAGNPDWLATHAPAASHSAAVHALLAAGAELVGKTITDELAYSIHGDNAHYGTPLNSRAPDHVPGGSSSGSASAVAAGLCDFALATDTGGSTRVPASYCGLWGLRTTHARVSSAGLVPLSPQFDTATWLAAHAETFARVGPVLLGPERPRAWRRAVVLQDACAQAEAEFQPLVDRVAAAAEDYLGVAATTQPASSTDLETWRRTYVTLSAYDAWRTHADWITRTHPRFGAAIEGRWRAAAAIGIDEVAAAAALQETLRAELRSLLGEDGFAILPSASSAAPRRDADPDTIDGIRAQTFRITSLAGLAGLPQVSIPFLGADGLPRGVSLLGPAGSDQALIALACEIGQRAAALGTGTAHDATGAAVAQ